MKLRELQIPENAADVMAALNRAGYEAFIVGGAVRDALLGRQVDDVDIASNADAETATRVLADAGAHVIPTGIAHGTVTAVLNGEAFEVTAFRVDGDYSDARHPDSVHPARTIEEDLARRDFTVNAMAYNADRGLVDPFHGSDDLARHLIRCVGDPETRFGEDALRILRALRFSAQLGFEIEPATARAMRGCARLLTRISVERVCTELSKAVSSPEGARALGEFSDVVAIVIPEIELPDSDSPAGEDDWQPAWREGLRALEAVREGDLALRLAALLGELATCSEILARLRFPRSIISRCTALIDASRQPLPATGYEAKLLLHAYGADVLSASLELRRAREVDGGSEFAPIDQAEHIIREILERGDCFTLGELAVDGSAVMNAWGVSGKDVGESLAYLLDQVMHGDLPNEEKALLAEKPTFLQ